MALFVKCLQNRLAFWLVDFGMCISETGRTVKWKQERATTAENERNNERVNDGRSKYPRGIPLPST
jgi:primase-polymerase (primpol)-like protein